MKYRDPKTVAIYTIVSFGIYSLFWLANTRDEIHEKLDAKPVPSMWWFLLPFGGYWWVWLYSEAAEKLDAKVLKRNDTFLLFLFATMAGGFSMRFDGFDDDATRTISAIFLIFGLIISLGLYSLFPAVMQSKFNKLSDSKPSETEPTKNS